MLRDLTTEDQEFNVLH
ncbi:predicted protein [Fibroporia radiculosa]|uniref:Uncharacterized protein n=1 Tax=Fibroporia radiculosa TaxID=599839 RepID=J4H550_9APHY|nr:predicted protein [Fibroporia radiculosa]